MHSGVVGCAMIGATNEIRKKGRRRFAIWPSASSRGDAETVKRGVESLKADAAREFGAQHLDRHHAIMTEVDRAIDRGHASGAHELFEPVGGADRRSQSVELVRQSRSGERGARATRRDCRMISAPRALRRWSALLGAAPAVRVPRDRIPRHHAHVERSVPLGDQRIHARRQPGQ